MNKYRWNLDRTGGQRPNWCKDVSFKRKIARFGPFHLWESIRILQKSESGNAEFRYHRGVGMSHFWMDRFTYDGGDNLFSKMMKPYYTILNRIFQREIEVKEVRNSKYIKKYPFVAELFVDVIRNRKLEQLGI
jgi:hypothetical protein